MKHKIALVGFGTVGQGLCTILDQKRGELLDKHGFDFDLVAVCSPSLGTSYNPDGLDISSLLSEAHQGKFTQNIQAWDAETMIRESNATVVCELAYTNLQSGEPAITFCKAAFETGKHVVTSNKGPVVLAYHELKQLADKNQVQFLFEGTVMSGTPVLNLAQGPLAGNTILSARGILNGTTNYILSQMERGIEYRDAFENARALGYVEADPSLDVDGLDAQAKVTIIANVVMGVDLKFSDVMCQGITHLTLQDIGHARQNNSRWKLIASATRTEKGVEAEVKPEMVPLTHPLSGIMDVTTALTFTTDLMGDVSIVGAGAGAKETGFSILSDLLKL